jgi:hypothetical protein
MARSKEGKEKKITASDELTVPRKKQRGKRPDELVHCEKT